MSSSSSFSSSSPFVPQISIDLSTSPLWTFLGVYTLSSLSLLGGEVEEDKNEEATEEEEEEEEQQKEEERSFSGEDAEIEKEEDKHLPPSSCLLSEVQIASLRLLFLPCSSSSSFAISEDIFPLSSSRVFSFVFSITSSRLSRSLMHEEEEQRGEEASLESSFEKPIRGE